MEGRPMDDLLSQPGSQGLVLAPSYGVPIGVVVLGLGCLALLPLWGGALWLAGGLVVFGLFLLLQTALLRLEFAPDALLVWRSIHLLPVLFDATSLREQLDHHLSALPSDPNASDA